MKYRDDFVTNSSSSSYIIAYKVPNYIKDNVSESDLFSRLYERAINSIAMCEGCETTEGVVIASKEQYDDYIISVYGWGNNKTVDSIIGYEGKYFEERYKEITKLIENGYNILIKEIGYGEDGLNDLIRYLSINNEYFIILNRD